MDWEQSGMVQNEIFWIQRLDFEYTQLLPSPVLKNLKLWTLGTPLLYIQGWAKLDDFENGWFPKKFQYQTLGYYLCIL